MDSIDNLSELDRSIAKTIKEAQIQLKINVRTQELLRIDGAAYGYCTEKARRQAALELIGVLSSHRHNC